MSLTRRSEEQSMLIDVQLFPQLIISMSSDLFDDDFEFDEIDENQLNEILKMAEKVEIWFWNDCKFLSLKLAFYVAFGTGFWKGF